MNVAQEGHMDIEGCGGASINRRPKAFFSCLSESPKPKQGCLTLETPMRRGFRVCG